MEEAGLQGYEVNEWNPVLAPAGISLATKTALQDAIRKAMADPEVLGRVRALSGEVFPDGPESQMLAYLKAQKAQWARIVREQKISVE